MANQHLPQEIYRDIEHVQSLIGVQEMLRMVCLTTGMGFSAVARVTSDHWVACSVRDEMNYGLVPGDDLKIETTICKLICDTKKEVLFDDVHNENNSVYLQVAKLYGFKSYISFPIILDNGNVFGTLCALDPLERHVRSRTITTMFRVFALWIALKFQRHHASPGFLQETQEVLDALERAAPPETAASIRALAEEMRKLLHTWN